MSTLTSSSTLADVKAAYFDNASYEEDGSVSKARAFITACRFLLLMLPKATTHNQESLELSPELIGQQMKAAQQYVAANAGSAGASGGQVLHTSFEDFRS